MWGYVILGAIFITLVVLVTYLICKKTNQHHKREKWGAIVELIGIMIEVFVGGL